MPIDITNRALVWPLVSGKLSAASETSSANANPISSPISSDEELFCLIAERDEKALLLLFRRYSALVYSVGRRILQDEWEAEDLVQEVFLRLHERETTFDPAKGNFRTWLVQMVYRRALDRRAYLRRRHFYTGTDFDEQPNALIEETYSERRMIDILTANQLRATFNELNPRQRQTLELFFVEGLTLSEIAERTGEQLGNVRHHYYRGLEHIRQRVREIAEQEKRPR